MEYIHHIYMGMVSHSDNEYVIVVPEEFKEKRNNYEWPHCNHIRFDYIPSDKAINANIGGMLSQSWKKTSLLSKYVKKYKPSKVFLITLISYIPFLQFIISSRYKIVAILYKIYLYEWKEYSTCRKILELLKYKTIVWGGCVNTVLVLNDRSAATYLNKIYHTEKFRYLADPYNNIYYKPRDVRRELNIPVNNKVFLHFGGLQGRKGTIKILEAIELIPLQEAKAMTFLFAGKVYEDIRIKFYEQKKKIDKRSQVLLFDDYCTKEFLADLCYSCDYILIPYQVTAQSSGLLGYAAHYGKPVIGPSSGLIGKMIRKYNLGVMLKSVSPENIAGSIRSTIPQCDTTDYKNMTKVSEFVDQIFQFF